jgi:predicted RNase H-like HicB family nuclease
MPRKQLARTFQVTFELELDDEKGPAWIVTVPSVQGCHTYGRSLAEARRNAREALAVCLDDDDRDAIAEAAVFEEDIRLPRGTTAALRRWRQARAKTEQTIAKARAAEAAAARDVTAALSLRDAGELLGMSPEGVRKVLKAG